jgi:hypothetical protein
LSVVLCGYETWSLTLREKSRLRVLRRIFGAKMDEVTVKWRNFHEELQDLYSSPDIVRVIKSRLRWAGYVARMGEERGMYRVLWEKLRERDHWGDPGVDGRIILRWIFRKWYVGMDWIGLAQDRYR